MPSAAVNAKLEKPIASEASDNSPVRQILVIIEHKIRNLEKRKSKLVSYRDIQKSGKELNADQKVAVAKYDGVAQNLDFARDLCKQISTIATSAERDAKKQAKKDARALSANETNKIRDVLYILDCLSSMGSEEARNDFLAGSNGAATLAPDDLKILDDIYPEVTPKHDVDENGLPTFHVETLKAAEHLLAIVDSRQKEVVGTTYARIKEIVNIVHHCGYFDRNGDGIPEIQEYSDIPHEVPLEPYEPQLMETIPTTVPLVTIPIVLPPGALPNASPPIAMQTAIPPPVLPAPAAAAVPAPAFPLIPVAPVTLQEVENAYFSQQYAQQPRPITDVIGSTNYFFLQESELDSPTGTPLPPVRRPSSPNAPVHSQTFTNQNFSAPQPHHYPAELKPGVMMPDADISQHYAKPSEVPRGPPFAAPIQMNAVPLFRAPLAGPSLQPSPSLQPVPSVPVQVTLQVQMPFAPPIENVVDSQQQTVQAIQETTTEDDGWADNSAKDDGWVNNTTNDDGWGDSGATADADNEWRTSPDTVEDRRDRPRGDNRGPPKYRGSRGGRGPPRGGPPRTNYQNGRTSNPNSRNGDGYQNGGSNFSQQRSGGYRENRDRADQQAEGQPRSGGYRENRDRADQQGDGQPRTGGYRENRDRADQQGGNYRESQQGGNYREGQQGGSNYQGYKGRGRGAPTGGMRGAGGPRGRPGPRDGNRPPPHFVRKTQE